MDQDSTLRSEGHVDDLRSDWARGWVWLPDQPADGLSVELVDDAGTVIAETTATLFRADLEKAGKRAGRCGFEIVVPAVASGALTLRARPPAATEILILADGIEPARPEAGNAGPQRLSGPTGVVGWLDAADAGGLRGWCHAPEPFMPPIQLELVEGGRVVATGLAAQWRNDLEDFRQGDGRCGFPLRPPASLYDDGEHDLVLRTADGASLTRSPVTVRLVRPISSISRRRSGASNRIGSA